MIDFKEIPSANHGNGLQDTFELFARDFFQAIGFHIVHNPDRGPDGGKDLIISEIHDSITGKHETKWLVSCKHYAHGGNAVGVDDELGVPDRIKEHECDGFIGFYSTLPSSGLNNRFESYKKSFKVFVFDKARIENELVTNDAVAGLFKRYFPKSYTQFSINNPKPAKLFVEKPSLKCERCGKELIDDLGNAVFVCFKKLSEDGLNHYERAYISCCDECDNILKRSVQSSCSYHLVDNYVRLTYLSNPTVYIKHVMNWFNAFQSGDTMNSEVLEKIKKVFLNAIVR